MVKLKLKAILKSRGMSAYRLAKHLKMTNVSYVYTLLESGYDPKLSTLKAWATILRCKISDLFEDEDYSHLPQLEIKPKKKKKKPGKKRAGNGNGR